MKCYNRFFMPKFFYWVKSPKFLIFLVVFINFLGYGIVFPLLPILTLDYGGNPLISGVMIGIFSLMQVVSMPVLGRMSDRWGRKPLLLFSLWGTALSFAMMGVTHSLFWLLIARIIDGISGGNLSIAQAYIADVTDRKGRAGGMGIIGAGISLGFIIGPLWGALFGKISLSAPFIAATILTLISVFLTQFFLKESLTKKELTYEKKHFHFVGFLKDLTKSDLRGLFFINLLLFWAQSGLFTIMSLFGRDILSLDLVGISLLFALGGVMSALIQGFGVGKAVKVISEEKLFILSSIVTILGFGVMSVASTVVLFFIGITVFSIGNSFLAPVIQALVSEKSSKHEQGGNMGMLQSFGSIGRIFGPIVAGYIYQSISPFSPAIMATVLTVIILIWGVRSLL